MLAVGAALRAAASSQPAASYAATMLVRGMAAAASDSDKIVVEVRGGGLKVSDTGPAGRASVEARIHA